MKIARNELSSIFFTGFLLCIYHLGATFSEAGISSRDFGLCPEGPTRLYTLKNNHGLIVSVMSYGATVVSIVVPDERGNFADIALGFDQPSAYAESKLNFGTMGRYINRIAQGQLTLDGQTYLLTRNNHNNTMHGGKLGFNRHLWKVERATDNPPALSLGLVSPDGDEGFPGTLQSTVTFTLSDDNRLRIHYRATTDKTTVVNLSNHTLFNLSGAGRGTILHDIATVNADAFTPVDVNSVPTGEIRRVEGTSWDLRQPTVLSKHINDFGNKPAGYDFNYVLKKEGKTLLSKAGEIYDPESGRDLQVFTDQPGAQFYTGNLFDGTLIGKGGVKYGQYCALSLEAQHFPDSPHHANFPSTVLRPGETYEANIDYLFGTK